MRSQYLSETQQPMHRLALWAWIEHLCIPVLLGEHVTEADSQDQNIRQTEVRIDCSTLQILGECIYMNMPHAGGIWLGSDLSHAIQRKR